MADKYRNDSPSQRGGYPSRYSKNPPSRYERMPDDHRQDSYNPTPGYEPDSKMRRDPPGYYPKGPEVPQSSIPPPRSQYPNDPPRYEGQGDSRRPPPQNRSPAAGQFEGGEPRRRMSRFDTDESSLPASYPPRPVNDYPPQPPYGDRSMGPPNPSRQFRDNPPRDARHHDREERGGSGYPRSNRGNPYDSGRPERRDYRQGAPYSRFDSNADPNQPSGIEFIEDTCFASNLPLDTTITELAGMFGSIGVIKTDKRTGLYRIKIYTNPDGSPKGEASITYEDPHAANAGIEWFNGTDLRGNKITVQKAERTFSASYIANKSGRQDFRGGSQRGRGGDRGRFAPDDRQRHDRSDFRSQPDRRGSPPPPSHGAGGSRGGPLKPHFAQPGDWQCEFCKNNNFAWRTSCNRCNAPKSEDPQGANVSATSGDSRNMMPADPRGQGQDRFRERDPRS